MGWQDTDISFKKLNNKRITTAAPTKTINEERGALSLNVSVSELWADPIPGTPPGSTTSEVQVYKLSQASRLLLIEDQTVADKMTWFATTETDTATANDGSLLSESARLFDWIPDKYDAPGTVSGNGYEVKVYDKDGTLVPKGDASQWFFDYQTGILMFKNSTMDSGTVSARAPYSIDGYRYVGRKGAGSITSLTAGSGLTTGSSDAVVTLTGTFALDFGYSPTWTGSHTFEKSVHFASEGGEDGPAFRLQTTTSAPSPLSGGEFWYDGTALNFRHSGVDYNLLNTLAIGGNVGSGTTGSVLFVGTTGLLSQDTTSGQEFYYDEANHRLGLGTIAPSQKLELKGEDVAVRLNTGTEGYDARLYVGTADSNVFGIEVGGSSLIKATGVSASTVEISHLSTGTTTILGSLLAAPSAVFTNSSSSVVALTAIGTDDQTVDFLLVQNTSSAVFFSVTAAGQATLPVVGSSGGLLIGGDTTLYSSTSQVLKTGGSFQVGADLGFDASLGSYGLRTANIATANLPAAAAGNSGAIVWDTDDSALKLSTGASWVYLATSEATPAVVTGTGTVNTVAMFTGTSIVGDSIIAQDSEATVVTVSGNLKAYSKSFKIPHPLDPETKILEHGSLEGPEHGAYQRGRARGCGSVRVQLPDYWPALVGQEYTVHVTARGSYALYVAEQDKNGFVVRRVGRSILINRTIEFDWTAIGCRTDIQLQVEQEV